MTAPMNLDPSVASNGLPPDEVIDALLAGIVRVRRRVEIYESDGVTPFDDPFWNLRLVGGNITVDRDRDERRMCEFEFTNGDHALDIDAQEGFWYDKTLKAFWGIRYGANKFWETQIGEFMVDRLGEARFPKTMKVTGRDYTKKCLNTKIKSSVQFPQGTPIEQIVASLAGNSGITKLRLPYTGQSYQRDVVFERGTDRWKIMKDVCDSIGYEVYFTGDGYLTIRPYPDPTFSPITWIFRGGEVDGTLIDYDRSSNDSRIRNKIVVTGAATTIDNLSTVIYAEAANNDPSSPTRIGRLGERTEFYESDLFTTMAAAQQFADAQLAISALEEYEVNFSSLIIPWLDAGDIVEVHDGTQTFEYVPRRFLFSNFSIPMGLGPMTGVGRRVTLIGVTENLEYA